ncbi:hypothetical protein P691DRAFT_780083 [Macrolepiota fuliginosa MF-IS2]|uniref:F-box domain-containing protein n=1 Tax=Macrolepiota fuliginosa MF-IS2 TaxID=1400762 RepID=A0A9P6BUP2_9AGAR|nr:hypothetical protein P691DRAFT_780083 [Macrolepiota fuliginosa MF-IS2]
MPQLVEEIPFEIWELIAGFLPRTEHPKLMPINRSFFSIVLHERYGDIRWTILDEDMVRCLHRLQDPFIARHVQRLHIQAWFISQLTQRKVLKDFRESATSFVFRSLRNFAEYMDLAYLPVFPAKSYDPSQYTPTQILSLMVQALAQMTNLTCYSFEWRDLPLTADSRVFLKTANRYARGLQKLVLRAQIINFRHLLQYVDFEYLEEITFHFDYDGNSRDLIQANCEILETQVAPFINRFTLSLHRLIISSDSKTPMTWFFESLSVFPKLRALELSMPFDNAIFPDTLAARDFLYAHSPPLQHIKLNPPTKHTPQHSSGPGQPGPLNLNLFLLSTPPNILANLENLYIPVSVPLGITLALLQRSAGTLKRLTLSGWYLSRDELQTVYDVFSFRPLHARLLYLRIEVMRFDLHVLYDIAKHFPGMESLVIITKNVPVVTPYEHQDTLDPFTYFWDPRESLSTPYIPPDSRVVPRMRLAFQKWSLRDFSIYTERYHEHQTKSFLYARFEYRAMLKVKEFVQSIESFKGEEVTDGSEFLPPVNHRPWRPDYR